MIEINIKNLKDNFAKRYPSNTLTQVLLRSQDMLSEEQFLGAVSVWLAILDLEEKK